MKKTHKRLLGIGGLVLVAAITTIACYIPDAEAMTASASVDVSVRVVGRNPDVKINSPLDGAKLTSANLRINVSYNNADQIKYILSDGTKEVEIPAPELAGNASLENGNYGDHDFIYDLKTFDPSKAGYGEYTLKVVVISKNPNTGDEISKIEDAVSFSYVPAIVDEGKIPVDENNNPIVDLDVKTSVVKVEAIVFDEDGNEAFRYTIDTNGENKVYLTLPFFENYAQDGTYTVKFITYSYNGYGQLVADQTEEDTDLVTQVTYHRRIDESSRKNPVIDIDVEEGVIGVEIIVYDKDGNEIFRMRVPVTSATTNHIELPFDRYNLPDGEYMVGIIPYRRDENGNLIALVSEEEAKRNAIWITYGNPEVPNTGNFFTDLNLSEKDFLLTGLVIFTAATIGGILILRRKENRR